MLRKAVIFITLGAVASLLIAGTAFAFPRQGAESTALSLHSPPIVQPKVNVAQCGGETVTIKGTPGPDVLQGTPGDDVIMGFGGRDKIFARGGDDIICGGPNMDQIHAGGGNDLIFGNLGLDFITGGGGIDRARERVAICATVERGRGCRPLPPPPPPPHPAGWVNFGHGVYGPPIGLAIRGCESGHNYTVQNPHSSASGAFQYLDSTWSAYGYASKYGVSRAMYATPAQQDAAFVDTYNRSGTSPWNASGHCW